MIKTTTLLLAAAAALSLGSGAAMAQAEPDAQFLRAGQIPTPTYQWQPGLAATNAPIRNTYSVRTGHLPVDANLSGGSDGSASN
jgi:hypothetical protein